MSRHKGEPSEHLSFKSRVTAAVALGVPSVASAYVAKDGVAGIIIAVALAIAITVIVVAIPAGALPKWKIELEEAREVESIGRRKRKLRHEGRLDDVEEDRTALEPLVFQDAGHD